MKLYILTDCAAEQNYTPSVYLTREEAIKALKDKYESYTAEGDCVYHDDLYDTMAEVVYVDDTYNCLQIFEVEVPDIMLVKEAK